MRETESIELILFSLSSHSLSLSPWRFLCALTDVHCYGGELEVKGSDAHRRMPLFFLSFARAIPRARAFAILHRLFIFRASFFFFFILSVPRRVGARILKGRAFGWRVHFLGLRACCKLVQRGGIPMMEITLWGSL